MLNEKCARISGITSAPASNVGKLKKNYALHL